MAGRDEMTNGNKPGSNWTSGPGMRLLAICAPLWMLGCPAAANSPSSQRSPKAQKWFERASAEFASAQIDTAHDSVRHALDIVPEDDEVRVLGARIALARLEHDEVLRLLEGVESSAAGALRGRAYWYKGEIERTARELDRLLDDPDVNDPWAKAISKLAHRGEGRKPFDITTTEGRLESVQMAKVAGVPLFVVPIEIDGEKALSLVSTGTAEVMLDSSTRREPSWVSLRFGERLEVRDVPALPRDLTEFSMKLGVPIKALLGSNLLRHINATLDWRGRQFVARSFVPPAPPVASRVDVFYMRGGGMVLGSELGNQEVPGSLFVDSSMGYSVALDTAGWEKVGVRASSLPMVPDIQEGELRTGSIPMLQFGAFKLPQIPGVYGAPIETVEKELQIDIDGAMGAGLLSEFRLTFADGGRVLWVEQRASEIDGPTIPSGLGAPPGTPAPAPLGPPGVGPRGGIPGAPANGKFDIAPSPGGGTPRPGPETK
jgi:hypothetical protein